MAATDSTGTANHHHQPSTGTNIAISNGAGPGTGTESISFTRKPSHLSIDSNGANSAFLHTLNSQLQMAAGSQPRHHQQQHQQDASIPDSDFPLSSGIDRAALIAADFDTDEFLSARRHLPLEELKSQLIAHMKELKTELVELINSDYADFINLSTNLNGVDRMMEDLRKPLDRMKDDAIAVKSNLESVVGSLEQKLEHRAEIREKKASLQLLLNISESVAKVEGLLQISTSSEVAAGLREGNESVAKRLERVAIEYNQMQYLVSKGASLPFVTNIDWRLVRIKETMSENLSTVLRACIHPSQLTDADAVSNKESLTQCLRTYALIDQTEEAEKVITEELLTPFFNKTITRAALSAQSQLNKANNSNDIAPVRPLVAIYGRVLAFIDTYCSTLIEITQKELKGTNFDIPVNCIWGLSAATISSNIPQILQPGIADDFHRNYLDTMNFVSKIEELCGSRRSLTRLRSQPSYQAFMKRWLLPAYFQIRFKEISMSVEAALQANVEANPKFSNTTEVQLPASMAIIRAIERCWSPDVFIYGIAHSFWQFTLQLMARYSIWISTNLAKDLDQTKDRSIQSRSSSPAPGANPNISRPQGRATPTPGPIRSAGPVGKTSVEEMMLQQLSMVVSDVDSVTARIQEIFDHQIRPKLPPSMADEPILLKSFKLNLQAIRQDVPAVQERITALITKHCVDTLANVKTITSRYGEGPPREPSHFVVQILAPLSKYMTGPGAVLSEDAKQAWTMEVVVATTERYSAILAEKLSESKILEEQTNKVKAAGAKSRAGFLRSTLPNAFSVGAGSGGGGGGAGSEAANMSTHDKLRLQCVLDVRCYKTELTKFKVEPGTFEPFLNLQSNTQPYESLLAVTGQN
ncbi:Conserved oligomeric Golgi complex subunit 2 [Mortierella sp. GBA35]|nr:Conserved oligomeric Golgi complex subunit 2 [Mortierella sp. GBA35]